MRLTECPSPQQGLPRILILNPNSIESFTEAMQTALPADQANLDFYTAPDSVPKGLNGSADCVISAGICLLEIRPELHRWDAIVIACMSAHPLVPALRELTPSPIISILEAPLLLAATLASRVGIITTSRRWELLLSHEIASLSLGHLNLAGVVSSGFSTSELHDLPHEQVKAALGKMSMEKLVKDRAADAVVLGCAGMAGLEESVREACGEGVVVLDPVRCGFELALTLCRLGAKTAKAGMYATK